MGSDTLSSSVRTEFNCRTQLASQKCLVWEKKPTYLVTRSVRSDMFCVKVKETHCGGKGEEQEEMGCFVFLTQWDALTISST